MPRHSRMAHKINPEDCGDTEAYAIQAHFNRTQRIAEMISVQAFPSRPRIGHAAIKATGNQPG